MDLHTPILSNVAVDRFVRRVLDAQAAWTAAGEHGLARAPSASAKARMVTLLWAERGDAERWGMPAVANPRLKRLSLADLLTEVRPKLRALDRLVGTDWSETPPAPEVEPGDLALRLRSDAVSRFVHKASHRDTVWVLQGVDGPICLMSRTRPGTQMLPCWYDAAHAEARLEGPLAECVAIPVPLAGFCGKMLAWLEEEGRLVAPGYCEGDGLLELAPGDLATRLARAGPVPPAAA
jgi:hypothetical protein